MTTPSHDVIVVGLGAMGSAALHQLASRGVRVLGIDQFSPPHELGSTHGDTRITRLAIGEGMAYVPLAMRSHQLWREIELQTGADLLTANGCLVLGDSAAAFGPEGSGNFLHDTVAAAEAFGIRHEVLDTTEIARRFPQFALRGGEAAYLEPEGGFVRPEACVGAQLTLAAQRGADIRRHERVHGFAITPSGVVVSTTRGQYAAEKLVLSAGPWVAGLVGGGLGRLFTVHRQVMHWFATTPPHDLLTPRRLPVFIWDLSPGDHFYGFPAIDGEGGGMKVATEQFSQPADPRSVDREVGPEESPAFFDSVAGARLPALQRRAIKAVACLYTSTPDADFVIDWHPDSERVLIVSPCSGRGFKHSAAVGEIAAELVTEGRSSIDVRAFSLRRFAA